MCGFLFPRGQGGGDVREGRECRREGEGGGEVMGKNPMGV